MYTILLSHRPLARAPIRQLIHRCMGTKVLHTPFTYEALCPRTTSRHQDQGHTALKRYTNTITLHLWPMQLWFGTAAHLERALVQRKGKLLDLYTTSTRQALVWCRVVKYNCFYPSMCTTGLVCIGTM